MASPPNQFAYSPPFSQPERRNHLFRHAEIQPSPWVSRSAIVDNSPSLTLPTVTPVDLAEDTPPIDRLQSPAAFLPESLTASASRASSFASLTPFQRRGLDLRYPQPIQDTSESVSTSARSQPSPASIRDSSFSSLLDLTDSSPQEMAGRKRKAANGETQSRSKKVLCTTSSTMRRDSVFELSDDEKDVLDQSGPVDMVNESDRLQRQQQEDLIKQQQMRERNKPIRLADFSCIICMDSPTNLTITGCGKLILYGSVTWLIADYHQDIYSVQNVSTRL